MLSILLQARAQGKGIAKKEVAQYVKRVGGHVDCERWALPTRSNLTSEADAMANFEHLFEKTGGLPKSSESFWTSLFALYVLHLGRTNGMIKVWERLDSDKAPYYGPRKGSSSLDLSGLKFEDVSVEPKAHAMAHYFNLVAGLSPKDSGFEPDLVLSRSPSGSPGTRYLFVENKITQKLQPNQMDNYPRLVKSLNKKGTKAEFLLLMSVGSNKVDRQARILKTQLGPCFGLLLWEDILRGMSRSGLVLPGVDFQQLEKFTEDLDVDAA